MTATATQTQTAPPKRDEHIDQYHDRCDRCGAQAFVVATKKTKKLKLFFCGHHGAKHLPALDKGRWTVLDFRDTINEKPSVSANKD